MKKRLRSMDMVGALSTAFRLDWSAWSEREREREGGKKREGERKGAICAVTWLIDASRNMADWTELALVRHIHTRLALSGSALASILATVEPVPLSA